MAGPRLAVVCLGLIMTCSRRYRLQVCVYPAAPPTPDRSAWSHQTLPLKLSSSTMCPASHRYRPSNCPPRTSARPVYATSFPFPSSSATSTTSTLALSPSLSFCPSSPPASPMKWSATSRFSANSARSSGIWSLSLAAAGLAPAASRALTTSRCPRRHAQCSDVLPNSLGRSRYVFRGSEDGVKCAMSALTISGGC